MRNEESDVITRKILIVVDMQRDFIDGSLGTPEAVAIVPKVQDKIKNAETLGYTDIFFTVDEHDADYLTTLEGTRLPAHCIEQTQGASIPDELFNLDIAPFSQAHQVRLLKKDSFGLTDWEEVVADGYYWVDDDIEFEFDIVGLCTDICVISNALILRSLFCDSTIRVYADCCAGTTPEKHEAALQVMESCLIDVVR